MAKIHKNVAFGIWERNVSRGADSIPSLGTLFTPRAAAGISPSVLELFQGTLFAELLEVLSRQSRAPGSGDSPSVTASEPLQPLTASAR